MNRENQAFILSFISLTNGVTKQYTEEDFSF